MYRFDAAEKVNLIKASDADKNGKESKSAAEIFYANVSDVLWEKVLRSDVRM